MNTATASTIVANITTTESFPAAAKILGESALELLAKKYDRSVEEMGAILRSGHAGLEAQLMELFEMAWPHVVGTLGQCKDINDAVAQALAA